MKNISAGLKSLLASSQYLLKCDLYTFTLESGSVLYFTDAPQNIVFNGHTFLSGAGSNTTPGFRRGSIKMELGLQAGSLEVDMLYDGGTLLLGMTPGAFANAGGFDYAKVQIDKLLTTSFSDTSNGVVNLWTGVISDVQADGGKVALTVSAQTIYLQGAFPRNYCLPQDNNALFSPASGLSASAWAVNGSVTSATSTTLTASALTQADGWFSLGYITFTSGALNGLTRMVKSYSSKVFTLLYPLPSIPAAGDTFTAYPGYDGTQAMCQSKFNNLAHFRGFPYVPTPEVLELGSAGAGPNDNSGAGAGMGGGGGGGIGRGVGGQAGRFEQR